MGHKFIVSRPKRKKAHRAAHRCDGGPVGFVLVSGLWRPHFERIGPAAGVGDVDGVGLSQRFCK
jgi:hypothetical protein